MLPPILFAQQEQPPPPPEGKKEPSIWDFAFPAVMVAMMFYFLFVVPQRREKQNRQQLLNALKKDDEVVTSAGIIGRVASIKDKEDEVTLKIDDNVRMRVLRSSIVRIVPAKEQPKEQG